MKKHVHSELIKAWADGAQIEYFSAGAGDWVEAEEPTWLKDAKYRIAENKIPSNIKNAISLLFPNHRYIAMDESGACYLYHKKPIYMKDEKLWEKDCDDEYCAVLIGVLSNYFANHESSLTKI